MIKIHAVDENLEHNDFPVRKKRKKKKIKTCLSPKELGKAIESEN